MNEEWKYVDGFRDLYEVSNLGRVRSYSTYPPRVLKLFDNKKSMQLQTNFSLDGQAYLIRPCILVLEAFVSPRPDGLHCCHNDGDYHNNILNNLRWDTSYSNMQDKIEHGNNHQLNKNYCPKKHEYNKQNTIVRNHRNTRECRACARAADTIRNGKGLKENFLEIANHHYKNIMLGYSDV